MASTVLLKLALLEGTEMLEFRHGNSMYIYCKDCVYSETIPVETKPLGCSIGDDPEVKKFSDEYKKDKKDPSVEKCPGFEGIASATSGVGDMQSVEGSLHSAEYAEAGMTKEIPADVRPHDPIDWDHALDEALEDLAKKHPEDAGRIQFAYDMVDKLDHKTQREPEQEYDYFGELEEHPSGNITPQKRSAKHVHLQFRHSSIQFKNR